MCGACVLRVILIRFLLPAHLSGFPFEGRAAPGLGGYPPLDAGELHLRISGTMRVLLRDAGTGSRSGARVEAVDLSDQPPLRAVLLGFRVRLAALPGRQAQHDDLRLAAHGGGALRRPRRVPARRERRGDRLGIAARVRHRRRHGDERAEDADSRDPPAAARAEDLHRRRRPVRFGAGGVLRRPVRRHVRRRGGDDLAAVPRRLCPRAADPAALRTIAADRHDPGAAPALRSAQGRSLRVRGAAVLARLSVPVRVLRHHRDLRPPAPRQGSRATGGRAGRHAARRLPLGVHRRRQLHRQQEEGQGAAGDSSSPGWSSTTIRCG